MSLRLRVKPPKSQGQLWGAQVTVTHVGDAGDWVYGATKRMALQKLRTKMARLELKQRNVLWRLQVSHNMILETLNQLEGDK